MIYNVFDGMLNLALSIYLCFLHITIFFEYHGQHVKQATGFSKM